jgi:hypothetical protein
MCRLVMIKHVSDAVLLLLLLLLSTVVLYELKGLEKKLVGALGRVWDLGA